MCVFKQISTDNLSLIGHIAKVVLAQKYPVGDEKRDKKLKSIYRITFDAIRRASDMETGAEIVHELGIHVDLINLIPVFDHEKFILERIIITLGLICSIPDEHYTQSVLDAGLMDVIYPRFQIFDHD